MSLQMLFWKPVERKQMFSVLNASSHKYNPQIYDIEFKELLSKIVLCYFRILKDHVQFENNENKIRDKLLLSYLRNDIVREEIKLKYFLFDREVSEDDSKGRTDIKIQTKNTFEVTSAYFIIECKRLDDKCSRGSSGLNADYVKEGIMRFVTGYYSCFCGVNGMIGFIIKEMDIHANITNLNYIIKQYYPQSNTRQNLQKENFIEDFDYHYSSEHNVNNSKKIDSVTIT